MAPTIKTVFWQGPKNKIGITLMCLCITQVWRIRVHSNCWSPVEWIALRKCSSGQCPGKMSQLDQMLRITLQIFEILSLCREQKKSKICRTNKFGQRPKLKFFSLWGILLVPGKIGWGIVSKKCWSFGLQSFKGKISMHGRWSWCSASLQKPWCTIQAEDLVQYSWLFWCSTKYSWLRSATETAPALHRPWTPALHITPLTYPMKIYLYEEKCPESKTGWKWQTFFKTMFWSSFPWGQSVRRNRVKTTKETKVAINLENFY